MERGCARTTSVALSMFDLPYFGDRSLLGAPHGHRRTALVGLGLDDVGRVAVRPPSSASRPPSCLRWRTDGLECVVFKRRRSLYEPGRRSSVWVKIALLATQEFYVSSGSPSAHVGGKCCCPR